MLFQSFCQNLSAFAIPSIDSKTQILPLVSSQPKEYNLPTTRHFTLVHQRHRYNFVASCWANNTRMEERTTRKGVEGCVRENMYNESRTRRPALNFNITKSCNPTDEVAGALTLATQFIKITMKLLLREV